jgi:acyl carrier protein
MEKPLITEKAKSIISLHFDVEEARITTDSRLIEDLGLDSLDMIEVVIDFEDEFSMEIPDDEAEKIKTFGELVAYLENRLK